ncbi:hypothetical protein A4X09_0g2818 [Tilletia walkeri]|uniref:PEBP-like protein n=1 Tax=Tilletia walkeri TaxID=117179 RepID=A0A8X7T5S5_9BASI|nr:hypothetical protein A4X09_0g2818 [Tilletia walkeri]
MRSFATLAASVLLAFAASTRAAFDADVESTAQAVADAIVSFQAQNLTPDPVPADVFQPIAALTVTYPQAGIVGVGQRAPKNQVQDQPTYSLNITSGEAANFRSKLFTVLVADPGAPSSNYNGLVVRHCLGNNFTIGSDGVLKNTTALVTSYMGPAPPAGSGPHRYMHLVLAQPSGFRAPADLSQPNTPLVTDWNLSDYFKEANLGPIVAASFMIVQEGQTTASTVTTAAEPNTASISATAAQLETKFSSGASSTAAPTGTNTAGGSGGNTGAAVSSVHVGVLGVSVGAIFAASSSLFKLCLLYARLAQFHTPAIQVLGIRPEIAAIAILHRLTPTSPSHGARRQCRNHGLFFFDLCAVCASGGYQWDGDPLNAYSELASFDAFGPSGLRSKSPTLSTDAHGRILTLGDDRLPSDSPTLPRTADAEEDGGPEGQEQFARNDILPSHDVPEKPYTGVATSYHHHGRAGVHVKRAASPDPPGHHAEAFKRGTWIGNPFLASQDGILDADPYWAHFSKGGCCLRGRPTIKAPMHPELFPQIIIDGADGNEEDAAGRLVTTMRTWMIYGWIRRRSLRRCSNCESWPPGPSTSSYFRQDYTSA